jgi:hypothetical protein
MKRRAMRKILYIKILYTTQDSIVIPDLDQPRYSYVKVRNP